MILATFDLLFDISNEVLGQIAFWSRIKKNQNRFSTWLLGRQSWISQQYDFSCFFILKSAQKKFKIDVQDGGHIGFSIRKNLASFDLQVTQIHPTKFRGN